MFVNSLWFTSLRVQVGSGAGRNWKETWVLGSSQLYYLSHLRKILVSSSYKINMLIQSCLHRAKVTFKPCTFRESRMVVMKDLPFFFHFIKLNEENSPGNIWPTKLDDFTSMEKILLQTPFHSDQAFHRIYI